MCVCMCVYVWCIQGVVVLSIALAEETEDHIQAAAAWSLGQIGRHTPEHAKAVAQANVFPRLLECYVRTGASEDLQTKVIVVLPFSLCLGFKAVYTVGVLVCFTGGCCVYRCQ